MGHVSILLDKMRLDEMGLDEMGLDEMGINHGIVGEPGNEANFVVNGQVRTWHPNVVSCMISLY